MVAGQRKTALPKMYDQMENPNDAIANGYMANGFGDPV
jgi:hypothetical protein